MGWLKLHTRALFLDVTVPFFLRIEESLGDSAFGALFFHSDESVNGVVSVGAIDVAQCSYSSLRLPLEFAYLGAGDIIRCDPVSGNLRVHYRRSSHHNSLFVTERCNSRCLMCSQPPREIDDSHLLKELLEMIPMIAKETSQIGITGGEPTLLGSGLLELLRSIKTNLPDSAVHMLSNGRRFSSLTYAAAVSEIAIADLMVGIPLYADTAETHDFIVQAHGAFNQTILGALNLGRVGVGVEIRVVIHRQNFARLPRLASYIARNLPFVDQVSLMGLELMGYARTNIDALWVEPPEYHEELSKSVAILDAAEIPVHIFNHPLCLLPTELHSYARRSISDWKNTYRDECEPCSMKKECGGFFASWSFRPHSGVRPFIAS